MLPKDRLKEIIDRIEKGDNSSAKLFYDTYKPRILFSIKYHQNSRKIKDPEDIAHDVLMDVFKAIREGKFKNVHYIGAYLQQITYNKIADYFRKSNHIIISETDMTENKFNISMGRARKREDFSYRKTETNLIEKIDRREMMKKAIDNLERVDQQIILFYYYYDMKPAEIGKKLGIDPKEISTRKYYAMKELEKHLRKYER